MTMRLWLCVGLSSVALSACGGSDGKPKDRWLNVCATQAECSDGLICACGVCTVACDAQDACRNDAKCAAIEGDPLCPEAPTGIAQLCRPFDTIDGPMSCGQVAELYREVLTEAVEGHTECSETVGCSCIQAKSPCPEMCGAPVVATEWEAIRQDFTRFSLDYCGDRMLDEICDLKGPDCEECVAVCEQGRCVSVSRPYCDQMKCDDGKLCHIDNTCMAQGEEDGNGIAVLYTDADFTHSMAATEIVEGGIVWISHDVPNADLTGGTGVSSVVHLDFESGELTTLATGIRHDAAIPTLHVSGELVFYTSNEGISSVRLDGEGDAELVVRRTAVFDPDTGSEDAESGPWAVDSEFIYYATQFRSKRLHRARLDGTDDELVYAVIDDPMQLKDEFVVEIAVDEKHVYVEVGARKPFTSLVRIDKDNWSASRAVEELRDSSLLSPLFVSDDHVIYVDSNDTQIQARSLSDGEERTLVTSEMMMPFLYLRSISDGYVYYLEVIDREDKQGSYLARVPIDGGEPERLRRQLIGFGRAVFAAGDYLYWEEFGRVVRNAL